MTRKLKFIKLKCLYCGQEKGIGFTIRQAQFNLDSHELICKKKLKGGKENERS